MNRTYALIVCLLFSFASNAQLSSGLVAWWPFNGNGVDSSMNGHNGTSTNITYTNGRNGAPNAAAVFNGTSSYITAPYSANLNINKYSIGAIIKLNGFYTGACHSNNILSRGTAHTNGAYGMEFTDTINNNCSNPADTNVFTLLGEAGTNNANIPPASWHYHYFLHTSQWYSFVATYDSLKIRIYINGVIVDSAASTAIAPIGNSTDSIFIGASYQGTTGAYPYWFKGLMDDLRIYNRVLSASEIAQYNSLSVSNTEKTNFDISLYPNPTKNNFTIDGYINTNAPVQIDIINNIGQVVYTTSLTTHNGFIKENIATNNLTPGLYFLRLKAADEVQTLKLIIE